MPMRSCSHRSRLGLLLAPAVSLAVTAASARASDWIVNGGSSPALSVDARASAEIGWSSGGTRTYLVVPPAGRVYHGRLSGEDTSKRAGAGGLPNALVVRQTADGTIGALQKWDVAGQPVALHFARWSGAPTQLMLSLSGTRLTGTVTFHGKPVFGTSPTPSGQAVRIYVIVDCLGCAASPNGWSPMLGLAPAADGSFGLALRPAWSGRRYRATVAGPNLGTTLAPDAVAYTAGTG
ncbi:MAG TPA: hypothetical protein VII51_06020 [Gaiellaceae bacterium]